ASRKPRTIRKAPARSRPTVEILEDRMAPATLTVNTLGDNSNADTGLSLREAILLVNNAGNAQAALGRSLSSEEAALVNSSTPFGTNDTIHLPVAPTNQSLTLSSALPNLSRSVKIEGPGAAKLTVIAANSSGNQPFRVFQVDVGV